MGPSLTACHRKLALAILVLSMLGGHPMAVGGLEPGTSSQCLRSCGAVTDQLVVRTRAGLQHRLRHDTFAAHGAQEVARIEPLGVSIIRVPHARAHSIERALRRSRYFKSIEPDHIAVAAQVPNDPELASQWGLTKIGARTAWDVSLGSPDLIVAIVDSGVDASHPDLRNQLVAGYDFVNDDADATDDNGHGTQMAGIVAAEAFNGIGVSGIAPRCKLMPIKVLDRGATGDYSAIANGISYAADHGARVINLSLTGSEASPTLESAVNYATARGALVVAAAGNEPTGNAVYPAAYANAIGVSATDRHDKVAGFSNYGSFVAFAAPGVGILTTNLTAGGSAAYLSTSGTSAATAFVSGALALLLSAHPELPAASAVSTLANSARDLGTAGWDPYAGWGRINVAAALTDSAANPVPTAVPDRSPPNVSILTPKRNSLLSGQAAIDVAATDDVGVASVDLTVDDETVATDTAPPFGFLWDSSAAAPGKHTLRARAYDAAGNVKTSKPVRISVTHGVGMSVTRARLTASDTTPNPSGTLSLTAMIALPEGVALDPGASSLTLTLSSSKGTLLSAFVPLASTTETRHGIGRFSATGADPHGGLVEVRIAPVSQGATSKLSIFGSGVDLANADSIMSLALKTNALLLSQSVTFRSSKSSFVFP